MNDVIFFCPSWP